MELLLHRSRVLEIVLEKARDWFPIVHDSVLFFFRQFGRRASSGTAPGSGCSIRQCPEGGASPGEQLVGDHSRRTCGVTSSRESASTGRSHAVVSVRPFERCKALKKPSRYIKDLPVHSWSGGLKKAGKGLWKGVRWPVEVFIPYTLIPDRFQERLRGNSRLKLPLKHFSIVGSSTPILSKTAT